MVLTRFLGRPAVALLPLVLVLWAGASALAQAPAPTQDVPAANGQAAPRARARLDGFKQRLDQIEASLSRRGLTDEELVSQRAEADQAAVEASPIVDRLGPRAEAVKARVDELGGKPQAGAPPDSPDLIREREERRRELAELDETLRLGKALLVQADQIKSRITERRRNAFTRMLFERSQSILSPGLWLGVAAALPADARAVRLIAGDWFFALAARVREGRAMALVLALAAVVALYVVRARVVPRIAARDARIAQPSRLRRAITATWRTLFAFLPALAAGYLVYHGLNGAGLLPPRIEPVVRTLIIGIAFVVFARSFADAMLAPHKSNWRLIEMRDQTAERLHRLVFAGSAVIVAGKVVESVLQTVGATLPTTIATRGTFAVVLALLVADTLRRIQDAQDCAEGSFGPYTPTRTSLAGPLRIAGWATVIVVLAAALIGFIAFASFLVDQIVWASAVLATLTLAVVLVDEGVGRTFADGNRISMTLRSSVGLRKRSLDQFAVLGAGFARVILIVVAAMLVLAPWGLESTDIAASVRAAFFGFKVGNVTVSLAAVGGALLLFIIAIAATRGVQRWLEARYLPVTDLDAGLRNSIKTGVGYLGFFAAAALALSQLGLSLANIAIVAGALSVGIGFGLQSIVNNFVSGLILLWERSIRVGDWIVVGSDQGHVRRINVRSTEIETFDRAAVIVPNSNLVSGVVKNWLHNNRTGRIAIPVTVAFRPDPQRIADILLDCAGAHPDVLHEPQPTVIFLKFSEAALDFELRCFVNDVEASVRIKSDLHFAIFARLAEGKIYVTATPAVSDVKLHLPEHIEAVLARLVEAETKPKLAGAAET